ncbi:MAG: DUF1667 domain-containing protein [Clostridia bacterium]|nr:DUF1667 domain-containing protein [Clostridia bacterium]
MSQIKEFRCVVCPLGCSLRAEIGDDGQILSVTGNTCPRGKNYAVSELTHPVRTLTSTVFSEDGQKIPVRTSAPMSKEKMFDAMKIIHSMTVALPVRRGDVLKEDFMDPGVNLIVCKDTFPKA